MTKLKNKTKQEISKMPLDRVTIDIDCIRIRCTVCNHTKEAHKNFRKLNRLNANGERTGNGYLQQCNQCLSDIGLRIRQEKLQARLDAGYPIKACPCGRLHDYPTRSLCDVCNSIKNGSFGRFTASLAFNAAAELSE